MSRIRESLARIRNVKKRSIGKDFTYSGVSYLVLSLFLAAGYALHAFFAPQTEALGTAAIAAGAVLAAGALTVLPAWSALVQLVVLGGLAVFAFLGSEYAVLYTSAAVGLLVSAGFELVYQWDKIVILRMGKFHTVRGPGLFFMLPIVDRAAAFIDTRIRATDFSAEKTLTRDTVPVHVDALTFWMIWDARRAVLEVEDFLDAVVLSATTALRDSIGKHELATLLSERDRLGKEIQRLLDAKTNPWGITILSVEITDIIIPQALEDAMSKRAQAERERQSRVILGTAEVEIAKKFEEASASYVNNPTALHLRAMNMVYEGLRQKGAMVLLPASALETMNLGTVLGATAMQKVDDMDARGPGGGADETDSSHDTE